MQHTEHMHVCRFIAQEATKRLPPQVEEIDVAQVIGMVIALIAVIYTIATSVSDIFRKKKPPHDAAVEKEKKSTIEEFLKSMEAETEEDDEEEERQEEVRILQKREASHKPPPAPREAELFKQKSSARGWPRPEEKFIFHTNIEDFKQKTAIDERKLEVKLRTGEDLISDDLKVWGQVSTRQAQAKDAPIHQLVKNRSSKKALIIAAEIIQPPVGFRKPHKFP